MSLRPLLLSLWLPLLLLSGAGRRAEAGPETESPVRTLQVETLVRRTPPPSPAPRRRLHPSRPGIVGERGALNDL